MAYNKTGRYSAKQYSNYTREQFERLNNQDLNRAGKSLTQGSRNIFNRMYERNIGGKINEARLAGLPGVTILNDATLSIKKAGLSREQIIETLTGLQGYVSNVSVKSYYNDIKDRINKDGSNEGVSKLSNSEVDELLGLYDELEAEFGSYRSPDVDVMESISDYIESNKDKDKEEIFDMLKKKLRAGRNKGYSLNGNKIIGL